MADMRKLYREEGRDDNAENYRRRILSYYQANKKNRSSLNLDALNSVAELSLGNLKQAGVKAKNIELAFPEKRFNSLLKSKLASLDAFTSEAVKVQKIGSGDGIVLAYKYLVETYAAVIQQIRSFRPPGKPDSYVKSFSGSMQQLTAPIYARTKAFKREAKEQILKNRILSVHNKHFLISAIKNVQLEYNYYLSGVLMDKGGIR